MKALEIILAVLVIIFVVMKVWLHRINKSHRKK